MPKVREVLGHLRVEMAKKERICHRHRTSHAIARGGICLAIYGGAPRARKNYCRECAKLILDRAEGDLGRIRAELYGSS